MALRVERAFDLDMGRQLYMHLASAVARTRARARGLDVKRYAAS
jgi:hypothetical protein